MIIRHQDFQPLSDKIQRLNKMSNNYSVWLEISRISEKVNYDGIQTNNFATLQLLILTYRIVTIHWIFNSYHNSCFLRNVIFLITLQILNLKSRISILWLINADVTSTLMLSHQHIYEAMHPLRLSHDHSVTLVIFLITLQILNMKSRISMLWLINADDTSTLMLSHQHIYEAVHPLRRSHDHSVTIVIDRAVATVISRLSQHTIIWWHYIASCDKRIALMSRTIALKTSEWMESIINLIIKKFLRDRSSTHTK